MRIEINFQVLSREWNCIVVLGLLCGKEDGENMKYFRQFLLEHSPLAVVLWSKLQLLERAVLPLHLFVSTFLIIALYVCFHFPPLSWQYFLYMNFLLSVPVFHRFFLNYYLCFALSGERGEVLHWNWRKQPDARTQDRSTLFLMSAYLPSWLILFLHSVLSLIRGKLKRKLSTWWEPDCCVACFSHKMAIHTLACWAVPAFE